MPQIIWIVDSATGELTTETKGIKGKGCKPIFDVINTDLTALGLPTIESHDTPEINEPEVRAQQTQRIHLGR